MKHMTQSNIQRTLDLADEIIGSTKGVRLKGRFVSFAALSAVCRERGWKLLHESGGVYTVVPLTQETEARR